MGWGCNVWRVQWWGVGATGSRGCDGVGGTGGAGILGEALTGGAPPGAGDPVHLQRRPREPRVGLREGGIERGSARGTPAQPRTGPTAPAPPLTSTARQSGSTEGSPQPPAQQNSSMGAAIFRRPGTGRAAPPASARGGTGRGVRDGAGPSRVRGPGGGVCRLLGAEPRTEQRCCARTFSSAPLSSPCSAPHRVARTLYIFNSQLSCVRHLAALPWTAQLSSTLLHAAVPRNTQLRAAESCLAPHFPARPHTASHGSAQLRAAHAPWSRTALSCRVPHLPARAHAAQPGSALLTLLGLAALSPAPPARSLWPAAGPGARWQRRRENAPCAARDQPLHRPQPLVRRDRWRGAGPGPRGWGSAGAGLGPLLWHRGKQL